MPSRQFMIQQAILNAVYYRSEHVRKHPDMAPVWLRAYSHNGDSIGDGLRQGILSEYRILEARYS